MIPSTTIELEENAPHLNISAISRHIEKYEDFAIVHTIYTNDYISTSEKMNEHYHISPIKKMGDGGKWMNTDGCCYDNQDIHGKVIMNKEEMLINFTLIFGKTVEYEIEMECDGWHSNDKVSYMGKIRK